MTGERRRGERRADASNEGADQIADLREDVATLKEQMKTALEGVGNFRDFQRDAREFFTESRTRDEEKIRYQKELASALDAREKKADKWWKRILTWVLIVGGLVALGQVFGPVIRRALNLPVASSDAPKAQSSAQDAVIPPLARR